LSGEVKRMSDEPVVVLYVDDNPKSRRLLTGILTHFGFKVIAVGDPSEALSCYRHAHFDLALLDYQMPFMSGSELAQEIKLFAPDIPVVLISGCSTLPASELSSVDVHFGRGTAMDDLVHTMWKLVRSKPINEIGHSRAWADST
jgi:CheY-like chemotaxis protein